MIAWVRYNNGDLSLRTCNSVYSEGLLLVVFALFRNIFRASERTIVLLHGTHGELTSLLIINYPKTRSWTEKQDRAGSPSDTP